MDWHLIKTETERPVITARTMQSAVLIRKRRAMVSGRLHSMKPEEVWQEIEEKGGMKEDKNWEGDE